MISQTRDATVEMQRKGYLLSIQIEKYIEAKIYKSFQYEEQHEWGPRGRKLWAIYEVQEVL